MGMSSCHSASPFSTTTLQQAFDLIDASGQPLPARRVLRDLAWLLFAADPLPRQENTCWWDEAEWLDQLQVLARAPQALLQAAEHSPRRLGLYAEQLLAIWLQQAPHVRLLLRHQPIFEGRRTIGDLDFIVMHERYGLIHIELAVKFFLALPGAQTLDQWVGTSLDDNLGSKWRHLHERQLPLSAHPAARQLLPGDIQLRSAWFKAWLFTPLQQPVNTAQLRDDYCRGHWGSAGQLLDDWGENALVSWLPLLQRLAPAIADESMPGLPLGQLLHEWQQETHWPRLLVRLQEHGQERHESARAWVVDANWPAQATQRPLSP